MINTEKLSIPSEMSKLNITSVLSTNLLEIVIGFCNLKSLPTLAKLNRKFLNIIRNEKKVPIFYDFISEMRMLPHITLQDFFCEILDTRSTSLNFLFLHPVVRRSKTYLNHLKKKISKKNYQSTQKEDFMRLTVEAYLNFFSKDGRLALNSFFLAKDLENFGILLEALKENNKITVLDLRDNELGNPEALKLLSEFLMVNKTITELDLEYNFVNRNEGDLIMLLEALKVNQTITKLNLRNNEIGKYKDEILIFSDFLKNNKSVTELDIANNLNSKCFPHWHFKFLCKALKQNSTITKLNLSNNHISFPKELEELSKALKFNKTITSLDLSDNAIGFSEILGEKFLRDLLEDNKSISKLNLSNNILLNKCNLKTFFEALKLNNTITSLNLEGNELGSNQEVVKWLIEAMEENQTIVYLDLTSNKFKPYDYERLDEIRSNLYILY